MGNCAVLVPQSLLEMRSAHKRPTNRGDRPTATPIEFLIVRANTVMTMPMTAKIGKVNVMLPTSNKQMTEVATAEIVNNTADFWKRWKY